MGVDSHRASLGGDARVSHGLEGESRSPEINAGGAVRAIVDRWDGALNGDPVKRLRWALRDWLRKS